MIKYPDSFKELAECFEMYPGIGPKTAERLTFFTLLNLDDESVEKFSKSLKKAKDNIKQCNVCGMLTDQECCHLCKDDTREKKIMVVESTKDVIACEKSDSYHGKYHVLNGTISPLDGIGPEEIHLDNLIQRIKNENILEVILSTSSSIEGEMTALYIKKMLEETDVKVYRIGYGLPAGANIEYADQVTLIKALEGK